MRRHSQEQYSGFAADYHWLYSDRVLSGEPLVEEHQGILKQLTPDARLLDCACGIGVHALALSRSGFAVQGTDGSKAMVEQATERAAAERADVEFTVCPWHELAAVYQGEFDVAFCCGNSIGHCRDEAAMLSSLRGIRATLRNDGLLVLNSRNWEKLFLAKPRFNTLGLRVRNGLRCIPLYVWNIPSDWGEEFVIEVVLIFDANGRVSSTSHRITYFPFRHQDLLDRLARSGFGEIDSDHGDTRDLYTVTARAC